jgi:translation elongation factor EF-1alpha
MPRWTQEIAEALDDYRDELDDGTYDDEESLSLEGDSLRAHVPPARSFQSTTSREDPAVKTKRPSRTAPEVGVHSKATMKASNRSDPVAGKRVLHSAKIVETSTLPAQQPQPATMRMTPTAHPQESKPKRDATSSRGRLAEALQEQSCRHLTVVFAGHVDAGKSTLIAQMLIQLGSATLTELSRADQRAFQTPQEAPNLAWMLDSEQSERQHGVTVDMAIRQASPPDGTFTISFLDCPGHQDFVLAFLRGAFLADLGVLVVDARPGASDWAIEDERGQTRRHAQILRHVGVEQLVVAINKMDSCHYDESHFVALRRRLDHMLCGELGWQQIVYVPCSGRYGENTVDGTAPAQLREWYRPPEYEPLSLLGAMDRYLRSSAASRVTRLREPGIFAVLAADSTTFMGTLLTGTLYDGQAVTLWRTNGDTLDCVLDSIETLPERLAVDALPSRCFGTVRLSARGRQRAKSDAGEFASSGALMITAPEEQRVRFASRIRARLFGLASTMPVLPGQRLELFTAAVWGIIVRIRSLHSDDTGSSRKKLRRLPENAFSIAEITCVMEGSTGIGERDALLGEDIALQPFALASSSRELGCFVLRFRQNLVAIGEVIALC